MVQKASFVICVYEISIEKICSQIYGTYFMLCIES